jgi:hypothetical protein
LLEQIEKQKYKIKALADNQVKVQHKTSESYRAKSNYKSLSREKHGISHLQIKRRKKLQSSVKKYALLHQP